VSADLHYSRALRAQARHFYRRGHKAFASTLIKWARRALHCAIAKQSPAMTPVQLDLF